MTLLPPSQQVDTLALESTFRRTTTSYKFLFMVALVDLLEWNGFMLPNGSINLNDIASEMLMLSWYPHVDLGLSLGKQDKLGDIIDGLQLLVRSRSHATLESYLRAGGKIDYPLERYVPYRLLRGFFGDKLQGMSDSKVNSAIQHLALGLFDSRKPVYRFVDNANILMHPEWIEYFRRNITGVREGLFRGFVNYVSVRNPGVTDVEILLQPIKHRDGRHLQLISYERVKLIVPQMDVGLQTAETSYDAAVLIEAIELLWKSYAPLSR